MLKEIEPQLLLLDLNLPDGNGIDLLTDLRKQGSQYPIWILSADAGQQTQESALQNGANLFMSKPLDVAQFHKNIAKLL